MRTARDLPPLFPARIRHRPYLNAYRTSGRGLTEIRGTHQLAHAEQRQLLFADPVIDKTRQARIVLRLRLPSLLFVDRTLAEHLVHHQRHAAAALPNHQQARALAGLGPGAEQESAQVDDRHQVAAHVGDTEQPRQRAGHRGQHRHGQEFVDLVDAADEQARADAIADAAPQPRRLHGLSRVRCVRQREPLVAGEHLERGEIDRLVHAALGNRSLMHANSSFSFTGLVMKARAPWRRPQTRSVSIDFVVIITIGTAEVAGSRVSVRVAWKPFMPGMITSMITRSGRSARTRSTPSSAVLTADTE